MARTGEDGELPSVAELLDLSQTKPLLIRGELAEKLAEDEPAGEETPPPDRSRRAYPFVFGAGAAVALGLAAVVFLQPHEVGGTPVKQPDASVPAPPPATTDPVETMSATAAPPTLTAGLQHSPVRTTEAPAGAGRKPAKPTGAPETTPEDEQWRDYVDSVISSWQHQPRPHWGR